jgi:DNA polymerase (family 10)
MTIDKATERLLKAIENPYTTMLGHLTGRLLLKREGYPLDMNAIIDACVQHKVIIEINAHPIRLDMDWAHIRKALDKGAIFSINPDAHELKGLHDMQYGIHVARKAGMSTEQCFNTWSIEKIEQWFKQKKENAIVNK